MSLIVDLEPEVEAELRARAAQLGVSPEEIAASMVKGQLARAWELLHKMEAEYGSDLGDGSQDGSRLDELIERLRLTPERAAERRAEAVENFGLSRDEPTAPANGAYINTTVEARPGSEDVGRL
jgi:hypothetical protein